MGISSLVIQKLVTTCSHVGRRIVGHHLKPYVHGNRNSLPIIDSDKTVISLRSALNFISHLIRSDQSRKRPARFMFVNTNPVYDDIFEHMSRLTGFGSIYSRKAQSWRRRGCLTNPCSPMEFKRNKKIRITSIVLPDCIIVVDLDNKSGVIDEAHRVRIPVVALVDSNTPLHRYNKIAYPIVVGQESVQFVYMMCNLITKTFMLIKGPPQHDPYADLKPNPNVVDNPPDAPAHASSEEDANETTEELKTVLQSAPPSEQTTLKDVNETTEELKTGRQSA